MEQEVTLMVFTISKSQMLKQPRPANGVGLSMEHYQVSKPQPVHAQLHGILQIQDTSMHAYVLLTPRLV